MHRDRHRETLEQFKFDFCNMKKFTQIRYINSIGIHVVENIIIIDKFLICLVYTLHNNFLVRLAYPLGQSQKAKRQSNHNTKKV